ncbi:MAG: endonuclease [Nitrospinae bacterium]|nr:endonuclease [Nitrospinota bacterium]
MRTKFLYVLIFGMFNISIPGHSQELDRSEFQRSSLVSREIAEEQLNRIYQLAGKLRTFHCGCVFDKIKQVSTNICEKRDPSPSQTLKTRTLEWVSMMPAHVYGKSLKCWDKDSCSRPYGDLVKGPQCCSEVSPKFKTRESDMHNLFPAMNKVSSIEENFDYGGMWEYEFCPGERPSLNIRGDMARAYLYMSYQYKISLQEVREDSLREWHFKDPPDDWEIKRNDRIEAIQGNRNPFIDHPEWVERVADF